MSDVHTIFRIDFPTFATRETIFVTSCLRFCTPSPSEKGSPLKGSNFFPLREDPFSEGVNPPSFCFLFFVLVLLRCCCCCFLFVCFFFCFFLFFVFVFFLFGK